MGYLELDARPEPSQVLAGVRHGQHAGLVGPVDTDQADPRQGWLQESFHALRDAERHWDDRLQKHLDRFET